MKQFINKILSFLKLAFCESGVPSSKRIIAGFMIFIIMFCTTWSVISYGMTENNKSVIEYEIVTAGALLGVTSITSIWKPQQTEQGKKKSNEV